MNPNVNRKPSVKSPEQTTRRSWRGPGDDNNVCRLLCKLKTRVQAFLQDDDDDENVVTKATSAGLSPLYSLPVGRTVFILDWTRREMSGRMEKQGIRSPPLLPFAEGG